MNRFEKKLKKELETKGAPTQDGYDELCHRLGITSDYVIGSGGSLAKPKKDSFFHFRKNIFVPAATLILAVAIGGSILITDSLTSNSGDYFRSTFELTEEEIKYISEFTPSYEYTPYVKNNEFFNINILRGYKKTDYSIGYYFIIRSERLIDAKIEFTSSEFQATFLTKEKTYGYINPNDDLQDEITMTITYNYQTSFMTFSI